MVDFRNLPIPRCGFKVIDINQRLSTIGAKPRDIGRRLGQHDSLPKPVTNDAETACCQQCKLGGFPLPIPVQTLRPVLPINAICEKLVQDIRSIRNPLLLKVMWSHASYNACVNKQSVGASMTWTTVPPLTAP